MPVTIRMPALSPTMTEGKIAQWLKKEGDAVRSGDLLAEIETDKATMEVEATDEGTLGKILAAAGPEDIAVNAPIAVLLEEGEDKSALAEAVKAAQSETPPRPAAGEKKTEKSGKAAPEPKAEAPSPSESSQPPSPKKAPPPAPAKAVQGPRPGGRVIASPLARRMAKAEGFDLARIAGSGPHGRIVKADIEAVIAGGGVSEGGGIFAGLGQGFPAAKARMEPHSSMRKVIAARLSESHQTVPDFYVTMDCDIDDLLLVRTEINETDETLNISVNDFVIRAAALALHEVPRANASWTDEGIALYDAADISVAVMTDSGGLITPIVRAADRKGLAAISAEMKDLVGRARAGKLKPEEYQGGTFSISNMGMFGVREFSAIINPPQGAILAVGAGGERVVVQDGEPAIATMMTLTLSCDHRVVDGVLGAQLLGAIKQFIEHPVRLIL